MKLSRFLSATFLAIFCCLLAAPAGAVSIDYTGDTSMLKALPGWMGVADTVHLYPGSQASPEASDNTLNVSANVAGYVLGGLAQSGKVEKNEVNISESAQIIANVYGGYAEASDATYNKVKVSGSAQIGGYVYGGITGTGNATENKVKISGSADVARHVYGGRVDTKGDAFKNEVSITGGTVRGSVLGGWTWEGAATYNKVEITGGTVRSNVIGGWASSTGDATNNTVKISGSAQIGGDVYGGLASIGNTTENKVEISGGTVQGDVYSGITGTGNATQNELSITGGTVQGDAYSGRAVTGNATGNSVSLSGGTVQGTVYGGYSHSGGDVSGNTLYVKGKNISVGGIANFDKYEFTLPSNIADGDTMLKSATAVDFTGALSTKLYLAPGAGLDQGNSITLVDNVTSIAPFDAVFADLSTIIDGQIYSEGSALKFSAGKARPNPRAKALAEGRAASMAFVNQGGDMAAGPGLMAAYSSAPGLSAFAAIDGGKSRYKSGSHVDVKGFSMLTGLAWKRPNTPASLMLGGFLEAGFGNYDSHNSFSGFASVEGDGDVSYLGGGLMGRYGFGCGLYFDGSMRVGRAKSDFDSDDLNYGGAKASYDSSTTYYGLHLGTGYEWAISPASMLDFYGKYLWTHQGSDSMDINGQRLKLDSSDSHRLRAGLRYSYSTGKAWAVTPYAGAAYEHEFDGAAGGTIGSRSLDEPELKGGTGIGEAGINISPAALDNLSLSLGVRGYVGQREGVTGNLEFRWSF